MENTTLSPWLTLLLALPVAVIAAAVVRIIWVPLARLLVAPLVRRLEPSFDLEKTRPAVVLATFAGAALGWVWFVLMYR